MAKHKDTKYDQKIKKCAKKVSIFTFTICLSFTRTHEIEL